MKLLIIAHNYPSKYYPTRGIFVEKMANEFVKQGIEVRVIAPTSVGPKFIKPFLKSIFTRFTFSDNPKLIVSRPFYLRLSNISISGVPLTQLFFSKAVKRAYQKMILSFKPNATYGHFLAPSGALAVDLAKEINAKSFIALGESDLSHLYDSKMMAKYLQAATGIISVSHKNTDYVKQVAAGISTDKILYSPNSVSTEVFYPLDKTQMRKQLHLPSDAFILVFVGLFIERKGVNRVLEAIKDTDKNIKILLIGEGPQQPKEKDERILFCGKVMHSELPQYLSAADAFILPTLSEGSCNAVAEAMACGLPIISSAIPEVEEQVSSKNGLLVNPKNIDEIRDAVIRLYSDKTLRNNMSKANEQSMKDYSISTRANNIIQFITQAKIQ